jgi:hypothetical protein
MDKNGPPERIPWVWFRRIIPAIAHTAGTGNYSVFGLRPRDFFSWAEAATLAVLPNAPGLVHPGRNRDALKLKRDDLLERLFNKKLFDEETLRLALSEELPRNPCPCLRPTFLPSWPGRGAVFPPLRARKAGPYILPWTCTSRTGPRRSWTGGAVRGASLNPFSTPPCSIRGTYSIPAVRNLRLYGVDRFARLLRTLGLTTLFRKGEDYGLPLILGGAEVTLWEITGLYAGLARAAGAGPGDAPVFPSRIDPLRPAAPVPIAGS